MAIILKLFLLILLVVNNAWASRIESLFKKKDYQTIVSRYLKPQAQKSLTTNEMIILSKSLRILKRYREDTRIISTIIKKDHQRNHAEINKYIKNKKTLDVQDYPKSLPVLYWYLLNDYARILIGYKNLSPQIEKDKAQFNTFRTILSELEFREGKVERLNDKVVTHLQNLEAKVYRFTASWNLQYVSWQNSANLNRISTGDKTGLIITNKGYCLGGDIGVENGYYHFNLDGCFLMGSGGVSAYGDSNITYEQSIPAVGVKIGPAASMIVSSSKSRLGIGLPLIYTSQKLTQPGDPDYQVKDTSPFSMLATINSRWQFDRWYLRIEFGQYFAKQESFWGLGFGRTF